MEHARYTCHAELFYHILAHEENPHIFLFVLAVAPARKEIVGKDKGKVSAEK